MKVFMMGLIVGTMAVYFTSTAEGKEKTKKKSPPAFLRGADKSKLYRSVRKGGWFGTRWGAKEMIEEVPVLEQYPILKGVDERLVRIVDVARREVDFIIFSGKRSCAKQKQMKREGKSQIGTCDARARHVVGKAIDTVFKQKSGKVIWSWDQAVALTKYMRGIGRALGIKCLRDGTSWSKDMDVTGNRFRDGYHLEIKRGCN